MERGFECFVGRAFTFTNTASWGELLRMMVNPIPGNSGYGNNLGMERKKFINAFC